MCQSESGFKKMLSNISRYYTMFVVTCDEQDYLYTLLTILHDNTFKKRHTSHHFVVFHYCPNAFC